MAEVKYRVRVRPRGQEWRRLYHNRSGAPRWAHQGAGSGVFTVEQVAIARAWSKRRRYAMETELVDPYPYVYGDRDCNADLLLRLNLVGRDLGKRIRIRSGRRTLEEQRVLYAINMLAPGIPRPGRPLTAVPNPNAPHVRGVAADCGIDGVDIGDYPGARNAMRRHLVCLPVAGETWHCEVGNTWRA